jgi:hypothetical protein
MRFNAHKRHFGNAQDHQSQANTKLMGMLIKIIVIGKRHKITEMTVKSGNPKSSKETGPFT